jgi:AcrR family transcriptional regulator
MNELSTRQRIVAAANRLFYSDGIGRVSVDAIAEAAGITKRSLYYHFKSKDDLVAAYLDHRHLPNIAAFQQWYDAADGSVADRIGAIFAELATIAARPNWKGCGFLRTAAELVNLPGHPAIVIGAAHKQAVEAWFAARFAADGIVDAEALARQVRLLLDGAFAVAMLHRDPSYFEAAGAATRTLVKAARRMPRPEPVEQGTVA